MRALYGMMEEVVLPISDQNILSTLTKTSVISYMTKKKLESLIDKYEEDLERIMTMRIALQAEEVRKEKNNVAKNM